MQFGYAMSRESSKKSIGCLEDDADKIPAINSHQNIKNNLLEMNGIPGNLS
jgi:hypothetical protein